MKIAFSGTHATGKTFAAYSWAKDMKLAYPDARVEVLSEVARKCPLRRLNKEATVESQMWMFSFQIKEEIELFNQCDILICDRTLLDYVAYTSYLYPKVSEKMYELAKVHIDSYDHIYFLSIENNDYLVDDGIREAKDKEYRKWIEDRLLDMYYELLGQKYTFNFKLE